MKYTVELASSSRNAVNVCFDDASKKATLEFIYHGEPAGTEEMEMVDNVVGLDAYKKAMGSLIMGYILNATFYEFQRSDKDDYIKDTLGVFSKALSSMVAKHGVAEQLKVGEFSIVRPDANTGPFAMVITAISNYCIHKELSSLLQAIRQLKLISPAMMDILQVEGETWVAEYRPDIDLSIMSKGVDLHLRRATVVSTTCEDEGVLEIHSDTGITVRCDRIMNFLTKSQLTNIIMEYRDKGKS